MHLIFCIPLSLSQNNERRVQDIERQKSFINCQFPTGLRLPHNALLSEVCRQDLVYLRGLLPCLTMPVVASHRHTQKS